MLRGFCLVVLLLLAPAAMAKEPAGAWSAPDLTVTCLGRGLETGPLLDLKVANAAKETRRFRLAPYTVLVASDPKFSPILLESTGEWDIKPKSQATFRVSGFSLQHDRSVPKEGLSLEYRPDLASKTYAAPRRALQVALQQEDGFASDLLPAEKHRLIVIQRLLWCVVGGTNPATPQALQADLTAAFARKGNPPGEKAIKALTASVWRDVVKCLKALDQVSFTGTVR